MHSELRKKLDEIPQQDRHWIFDLHIPEIVSTVAGFSAYELNKIMLCDFQYRIQQIRDGSFDRPHENLGIGLPRLLIHLYVTHQFDLFLIALAIAGEELDAHGYTRGSTLQEINKAKAKDAGLTLPDGGIINYD